MKKPSEDFNPHAERWRRGGTFERSARRDRCPVAGRAHLRVLLLQAVGVESGAVGVHAATAERRMTGQAVLFHVAPDARLETLSRGLAVTRNEEIVDVVIAWPQRPALGNESRRGVASRAEPSAVVAIAAARLARVGSRRMTREEARWMVARGPGGVGPMALEAIRPAVARRAGGGPRGRGGAVAGGEVRAVRRGTASPDDRAPAATGAGRRQPGGYSRRGYVAGQAALLRVARGAGLGRPLRGAAVAREEPRIVVARGCATLAAYRRGPRVRRQCLDLAPLRGVHVALQAELSGVARGAARSRRPCGLPVALGAPISRLLVRGGSRERRHVLLGEPGGPRKRHVTGRARRIGGGEVCRSNAVAIEAAMRIERHDRHPRSPLLLVTGDTRRRAADRCPRMVEVLEP